jgi:hypothetical protein
MRYLDNAGGLTFLLEGLNDDEKAKHCIYSLQTLISKFFVLFNVYI